MYKGIFQKGMNHSPSWSYFERRVEQREEAQRYIRKMYSFRSLGGLWGHCGMTRWRNILGSLPCSLYRRSRRWGKGQSLWCGQPMRVDYDVWRLDVVMKHAAMVKISHAVQDIIDDTVSRRIRRMRRNIIFEGNAFYIFKDKCRACGPWAHGKTVLRLWCQGRWFHHTCFPAARRRALNWFS